MWDMKTETLPVVVWDIGLIKKGLDKATSRIPGNIYHQWNPENHDAWNSPHTKESTVANVLPL